MKTTVRRLAAPRTRSGRYPTNVVAFMSGGNHLKEEEIKGVVYKARSDPQLSEYWKDRILGLVHHLRMSRSAWNHWMQSTLTDSYALNQCLIELGDTIPLGTSFNDWVEAKANTYKSEHPEEFIDDDAIEAALEEDQESAP